MTFVERWAAKLGLAGVLVILLMTSVVANVWFLRKLAQAESECETRIAELTSKAQEAATQRDTGAVEIAAEAADDAAATTTQTQADTAERQERVRVIFRNVPIPADCPRTLPDGVRVELQNASAAANRAM